MERRQFARIKINLQIQFKSIESMEGRVEGLTSDLSQGGIFLRTSDVKPVGTRMEMEVPIPGGKPVTVFGTVRSIRYQEGRPVGMGIEFDELHDPALGVIQWLIRQHQPEG